MTVARVLRILEYVGPDGWIERTLQRGAVPANGAHQFDTPAGVCQVRSAVIGALPEIWERDSGVVARVVQHVRPFPDLNQALSTLLDGGPVLSVSSEGFSYAELTGGYGLSPGAALITLAKLRTRPEETKAALAETRKAEEAPVND